MVQEIGDPRDNTTEHTGYHAAVELAQKRVEKANV